tara:strand:- start:8 stop:223 length:216 start_codon:yes stop_codon:yes gene_type:complete
MRNKQEISDRGVPNQSGLEIYVEITVFAPSDPQSEGGDVKILVPLTATDRSGNLHNIYRRSFDDKIVDIEA